MSTGHVQSVQPCPWCGDEARITGEVYRHAQCLNTDCSACGPCCRTKAEAATRWNLLGAVVRMSKMVRAGYQHAVIQLVDAVAALELQDAPAPRPEHQCPPPCPLCGDPLHEVRKDVDYLNQDQFDHTKAGDWWCHNCKDHSTKMGHKYFWQADMDGSRCTSCDGKGYKPIMAAGEAVRQCDECNGSGVKPAGKVKP